MRELLPLDPELKTALYYSKADIQQMKIHEQYMSQYRLQRAMVKRLVKTEDGNAISRSCAVSSNTALPFEL